MPGKGAHVAQERKSHLVLGLLLHRQRECDGRFNRHRPLLCGWLLGQCALLRLGGYQPSHGAAMVLNVLADLLDVLFCLRMLTLSLLKQQCTSVQRARLTNPWQRTSRTRTASASISHESGSGSYMMCA